MTGLFGSTKKQDPLPPPAPVDNSTEVNAAAEAERKRRAAQSGRASTILTGGSGLNDAAPVASKTLLGQ